MKHYLVIALVILLLSATAFAHGGEEHVMGTVTNISSTSITVKTAKNETKEVAVTNKTTFEKSGSPATLADLKVGDRVVIHAKESNEKLTAHVVRFGAAKVVAHAHSH